jgi:hypothetical protein
MSGSSNSRGYRKIRNPNLGIGIDYLENLFKRFVLVSPASPVPCKVQGLRLPSGRQGRREFSVSKLEILLTS